MANKKGASILSDDVDDTSNQTPGELDSNDTLPVVLPPDSGKSFATLVATFLAAGVLSLLVSKGFFTEQQSAQYMPLLQAAIVIGVTLVTKQFLKSRSDVKVEALKAHSAMASSAARGGALGAPMGGFNLTSILVALTTAQFFIGFMPGSASAKAKAKKALAAAIAAITELKASA